MVALNLLFGLALIAWPFFAFGSLFVFDEPVAGVWDEFRRHLLAAVIWLYPIVYVASVALSRSQFKRRCSAAKVYSSAALPLFNIAIFLAIMEYG